MGDGKVFETSNPLRDIFDGFNGQMTNAFLVNLNEVGKKDMANSRVNFRIAIIRERTLRSLVTLSQIS